MLRLNQIKRELQKWYWRTERQIIQWYAESVLKLPATTAPVCQLDSPLVVSLTSYPPRFPKLGLTLKCLLNQSVSPNKLLLWVAETDYAALPEDILNMAAAYPCFEIKTCEDTGSFKKIMPALEEDSQRYIVTADDDLFYPKNWLRGLIRAAQKYPDDIIAYRTHDIMLQPSGEIADYSNWKMGVITDKTPATLFATGCGGILYPPGCFYNEITDKSKYLPLSANADDVWLYWMARLKGTTIRCEGSRLNLVSWEGTDASGLAKVNVQNNRNDQVVKQMTEEYGCNFLNSSETSAGR